ncbi:MAG: hypothetical protein HC786_28445 [Richelia sp. CSU_2_1]|nr:hypothetical protein [Richelia sp. CSU_2_1]
MSDKIASLNLTSEGKNERVLEICALLNKPEPTLPQTETERSLLPVRIPTLISEGIVQAQSLQAISLHPICGRFLEAVIAEHYNGAIELTPAIQRLLVASQTFSLLSEAEAKAIRDRFDLEKTIEADKNKPPEQRRYREFTREVAQPPISWAQSVLGRSVEGEEILEIIEEF